MKPFSDETQSLRRCVRDLVALSTLPVIWGNADPPSIGRSLAEVLQRLLSLEFVYLCLDGRVGESCEALRTRTRTESAARTHEIALALAPCLDAQQGEFPLTIRNPVGSGTLQFVVFPIGHSNDYGRLAAASERADFPNENDRLLLSVGVNQAAGLLQRKEAEGSLREQTEWLRVTLASIGDGVITTDTQGRVTSMNLVASSLVGWTQEEAYGKPLEQIFRIVNEQTRQVVENPAIRALRDGQIVGLANHTILIAKDGTERAIDDSAAPIRDERGQVSGVVLIFRDVTEKRQAYAELRKWEYIFSHAGWAVAVADPETHCFMSVNPAFARMHGYKVNELIGTSLGETLAPEWRPKIPELARVVHEKGDHIYESVHVRKDGSRFPTLTHVTAFKDENGKVLFRAATFQDVTELKQIQQELTRAEQTTRFLADASAALAELTDYESTLQRVASIAVPYFADWCAVDMQTPEGSLRRLAVTHSDPAKVQLAHELFRRWPPRPTDPYGAMNVLRTGQAEWQSDIPDSLLVGLAQSDEHLRIMRELGLKSYVCVPLKARSRTLGVLTFVTAESGRVYDDDDLRAAEDLAARATIAIENATLLAALKESDRRKDEFLAMLAHELRNPLAPIRNAVQILRAKGPATPELQWARNVIDRQAEQMTRLVDDLLDVSRITQGKIDLRRERVQLAMVAGSAVESSRPLIEEWRHELTVNLPAEPVYMHADPTRLSQILSNLLNNAAKYTDPGGRIWLNAAVEANDVVIRVKDTGVGIPQDMLDRVFDIFTQVDRSLDRSQGGLGIGLTLVQRLVEMHGGIVKAQSDGLGKGSEFVVRLPVAASTEAVAGRGVGGRESVAAAKRRILVVDDNHDSADSLAMLLRLMGNEVHTAHDGLEALRVAIDSQPDVVLLDIGLPKLNGYEVARRIREQQPMETVLIAITGWGQDEDRRRSKEAGFDYHMTKPVEYDALQRVLANLQIKRS